MSLLPTLLGLAFVLGGGPQDETPPDWNGVWAELERLEAQPAETPQARDLLASLRRVAGAAQDSPRGELLARQLARLGGAPPRPWPEVAGERWPFTGREGWLAAQVLPPGPARVRAVLRSMDERGVGEDRRYVTIAWDTALQEARALRLREGALPIQERLHAAFHAPWSAVNLSLTRLWLGEHGPADAVLAEAIAAETAAGRSAADLWSQRGICALAAGDERRALDYLGRALAGGSTNAAVVLAQRDLDEGRRRAARSGFRALLWGAEPGAWALRGWGLSLLPGPRSTPDRSTDPNGR